MFLIDDILLSPFKALLYVFREIHKAVEKDAGNEAEAIRTEMSELYMLLETGQITEAEADAREKELLDSLDALEARGQSDDQEDSEDGEAGEETDAPDALEMEKSPPTTAKHAL